VPAAINLNLAWIVSIIWPKALDQKKSQKFPTLRKTFWVDGASSLPKGLVSSDQPRRPPALAHPGLFIGRIYDGRGNRMRPCHTLNMGVLHTYYDCVAVSKKQADKGWLGNACPTLQQLRRFPPMRFRTIMA
jgi:hypothetical protein